jgi:hypothetical protein
MTAVFRQNKLIFATAIFLSLVLSYLGYARAVVVNSDGICYLQSAMTMNVDGLKTAMHVCDQAKWPLYSMVIAAVVDVTHVSYVAAAYLCNGLFSLLTVVAFIYLVALLGGTRRVLWLAAFVILLSHEFNGVREYVVRDHGFWAFYLISMVFLLRYFHSFKRYDAGLWSVALAIATLFRVEGAVFLLCLPFAAWFVKKPFKQRMLSFVTLNSLLIVLGVGVLVWIALSHSTVGQGGRLAEVQYQLTDGVLLMRDHFRIASQGLAQHVLSSYAAHDASMLLFFLLIIWYGVNVISNVSLVYALLIIYAGWQKLIAFDRPRRLVVYGYLLVNLVITAGFLAEHLFLSKRYLIALSLVLMLWVPFALAHLMRRYRQSVVLSLMAVYAVASLLSFGDSKTYIRQAGQWLAVNAPANATIYSNDEFVMFYSNHFGNDIFPKYLQFKNLSAISQNQWKQYNFVALRISRDELKTNPIVNQITVPPIKIFLNKRGDEVIIFQVKQ